MRGPEIFPALLYALIHRSAWNKNSANFGCSGGDYDLPIVGFQRQLVCYAAG